MRLTYREITTDSNMKRAEYTTELKLKHKLKRKIAMGKKKISELTIGEAKEILDFVYPDGDHFNVELSFEPVKSEYGKGKRITIGGRSIIGITFRGGVNNDGMILHFDHSKVVLWLYKNHYDVESLLEENAYMSEMESDFGNFAFEVEQMSKGEDCFREGYKQNWTLDYVKKKCKELVERYCYKDYD